MGAHKKMMGNDAAQVSPVFSGKAANGEKRLDHGHVYILPLMSKDARRAGRIDRVLVLNPLQPFTPKELEAFRGVRKLWQADGRPDVQCVITWQGGLGETPLRRPANVVVSATPFVPTLHYKKKQTPQQFLQEQLALECERHRVGGVLSRVEVMKQMPGSFDLVEYRRNRKDDPVRPGFALRLTFDQPVLAPFSIGYAAHFGLGQFVPDEEVCS